MPVVNTIPGNLAYVTGAKGGIEANAQDDTTAALNSLHMADGSRPIKDYAMGNNRWLIGAGTMGGAVLTGAGVGALQGASLQSRVEGQIACRTGTTTFISGIEFSASAGMEDEPLLLAETPLAEASTGVIVHGCIFNVPASSQSSPVVRLGTADGVRAGTTWAMFVGCVFRGSNQFVLPPAPPLIEHMQQTNQIAGAVGVKWQEYVQVAFCRNMTSRPMFIKAVAETYDWEVTTVGNPGDIHSLFADAVLIGQYVVQVGDFPADVRDGMFAALQPRTYPPVGAGDMRIQIVPPGGGGAASVIELEALDAGTLLVLSTSTTGAAVSTVTVTTANVGASAVGTGNHGA